tara:strand:- start:7 stop:210 length:204 start_codon:yes stop_codon:yes gene_type:complete
MTHLASRKKSEEIQVGDLVRHTAGKQLGAGLVTQVYSDVDLIKVLWSNSNRIGGCSRPYLEVVNEGG